MLPWVSRRPLGRLPIRMLLIAVLVAAVITTVMDFTAPSRMAAAPRVSVSQIGDDSVNAIEAAYGEQARPATTGPVVQSASYTLTGQQVEIVAARKKEATADCASKLHKAAQAGWSYISARGGWRSRWTRRSRSSPPR